MPSPGTESAHFPRTYYETLCKDKDLVTHVRSDLGLMNAAGITGGVNGQVLDGYPGFGSYLEAIKGKLIANIQKGLTPDEAREISTGELMAGLESQPEFARLAVSSIAKYLAMLNFELGGRKVFSFSTSLVERLAATALDAPAEYLRLPFVSCMFVMRAPEAVRALYSLGGEQVPGVAAPITVFLSEGTYQGMRKLLIQVFHANEHKTFYMVKREILINPKWTIEKALRTEWNKLLTSEDPEGAIDIAGMVNDGTDEAAFYTDGLLFFRIIVNAILYLASSDPDLSLRASPVPDLVQRAKDTLNGYKRFALETKAKECSTLDGVMVGESLPPIVVSAGKGCGSSFGGGGPQEVDRRFMVRGHWRNQAHGEGMQQRKLMWIQPYWKGPEMAQIVNKAYVVQ